MSSQLKEQNCILPNQISSILFGQLSIVAVLISLSIRRIPTVKKGRVIRLLKIQVMAFCHIIDISLFGSNWFMLKNITKPQINLID